MKKLNKNTSGLTSWELKNPSLPIFANRYSALEEWESRIILLTLRYENKDTAYKPINSTLH